MPKKSAPNSVATELGLIDELNVFIKIRDMIKDGDSGRCGPYDLKQVADIGGEGEGEYRCRVYKITDTRDKSVQYLGIEGSYTSYEGSDWSESELFACSLKEMTVTKVAKSCGSIIAEISE